MKNEPMWIKFNVHEEGNKKYIFIPIDQYRLLSSNEKHIILESIDMGTSVKELRPNSYEPWADNIPCSLYQFKLIHQDGRKFCTCGWTEESH